MREADYTKLTCDMCGEEDFVKNQIGKVTGDGWMYVCGQTADYCPICADKISRFIMDKAEERRKHGTLVEVDEAEVQKENQEEHGRMVEKRPDGSCTYADGAVSVRCAICGLEECVNDPCDLTEELGWMDFGGENLFSICDDCTFHVRHYILNETTENLARMKKALARFTKPE
ncbi:MAG: hypothetical protein ACI4PL_04545 [Faecousia sp.]